MLSYWGSSQRLLDYRDFLQVFHVNVNFVPATNSFVPQAKQRKGLFESLNTVIVNKYLYLSLETTGQKSIIQGLHSDQV
jgi:hypothetical protein